MKKYLLALSACLVLVACEEEENQDNNQNDQPTTPTALNPTPSGDVDAVFVALNTASTIDVPIFGEQTVQIGTATANSLDGTDMGTVTAEDQELRNNGGGSYFYQPGPTNTEGISYDRSVEWSVGGGSNVGSFTYNYLREVPEMQGVSGDIEGELDLSQNVTISYSSASDLGDADSLYFAIYDAKGNYVLKRSGANQRSMEFTTAETSSLSSGFGYIQVNAFTYSIVNQGGADCAFIVQGSNTKSVTIK